MEFELLSKWFGLIALIVSVVTGIWTLISKSTKPFDDKFATQAKDIDKNCEDLKLHDRRIQKVEDILPHLPSKDEVHQIRLLMSDMNGNMGKMESTMTATQRAVQRIDDYLRETGK